MDVLSFVSFNENCPSLRCCKNTVDGWVSEASSKFIAEHAQLKKKTLAGAG